MNRYLMLILVAAAISALAADPAAVAQAVRTAAARPHPRLIFSAEVEADVRARMTDDAVMRRYFDNLRADADALLDVPPNERKQVGRRLLGVSRDVLHRVLRLAVVYRLTGDEKYLRRAEREMLAAAAFSDWNPSHYLDVAEMSTALALGYDWLYGSLPEESRQTIRQALLEKGLRTYSGRDAANNWNDVCNGGMIITALALAEDIPELASATLQKALDLLPRALETYAPEGGHPEGPGWYWNYATLYAVPTIASLESATGTDFGITSRFPGFMAGARFYLHMHGPAGRYFNYSDSGQGDPEVAPQMLWFAVRLRQPSLLWLQAGLLRNEKSNGRFDPLALVWWPESLSPPAPESLHYQTGGITPVASHRSSWTDPSASFIAFKGGEGDGPHGHLDIGSFIFESDGVRWAMDLGADSYEGLESRGIGLWDSSQEGQRWAVFRLNNFSHNTLVVNDQLQRVTGKGVVTRKAPGFTVMDIGSLYAPALAGATRGVRLLPDRRALIQDELLSGDGDAAVRWAMLTPASVTLEGARARLAQDGRTLSLSVLEPAGARLEIYQSDPPPRDYDSANPGTRMVGFRVKLAPRESGRLAVLLTPGSVAATAPPPLIPMETWVE